MYVVYNQPLAMLCDSPTEYEKEPEYTKFLTAIPTIWSNESVVEGKIGEYIVVTKECEDAIYVAGLNGNKARSVVVSFPEEYSSIEIYSDNKDNSYKRHNIKHNLIDETEIWMAEGGGFVLKFRK
jgi:alpha-glucosidase